MSIEEAIKQGLIKTQPLKPSDPIDGDSVLTLPQLQVKRQKYVASDIDNIDSLDDMDGLRRNPNRAMYDKVRKYFDPNERTVVDPSDNTTISLDEAFEQDIIDFAKAELNSAMGEKFTLEQAAARNLIEPELLGEILQAYQEASLGRLIDSGKFDPETGLVTDPKSGHALSLQAAINQKLIDPNLIYLYDMPSQRLMSLATAIKEGRYNPSAGQYCNPTTGEIMPLSVAEKKGLVKLYIDPADMEKKARILERLHKLIDTTCPATKSPYGEGMLSIEESIKAGIIDLSSGMFHDPITQEVIPLTAAIKAQKIDPLASEALLGALDKLSLQTSMDDDKIDAMTGQFVQGKGLAPISIQQAMKRGLINLDNVFVVDKANDSIVSLGQLVECDRFDPMTGLIIDPNTGQALSLADAIARGVIDAGIQPERYIDSSVTLKELIDSGRVNPRTTDFEAPNNHRMSIRDALANGFLTMNSNVKMDNGCVVLSSDEEIVRSLVDIKEKADWLNNVEVTLVSNQKPSQRPDRIHEQRKSVEVYIQKLML